MYVSLTQFMNMKQIVLTREHWTDYLLVRVRHSEESAILKAIIQGRCGE